MAQEPWGKEFTDRVGAEVARRRAALDLSAQQVADRTAELGHPVSRSVVSDLGNPRRPSRLTVPDWLVLAAALEMPPLALLFPGAPGASVEALPAWHVPAERAHGWALGVAPRQDSWSTPWLVSPASPKSWMRRVLDYAFLQEEIERREKDGAPRQQLRELRSDLRALRQEIKQLGEWGQQVSDDDGRGWSFPTDLESFLEGYMGAGDGDG